MSIVGYRLECVHTQRPAPDCDDCVPCDVAMQAKRTIAEVRALLEVSGAFPDVRHKIKAHLAMLEGAVRGGSL